MLKKISKKFLVTIIIILIITAITSCFLFKHHENKIIKSINLSTMEMQSSTESEEKVLETETESLQNQGNISYNGSSEIPNVELGDYYGLTYYSQLDSRWKNHLYTIMGDSSQTIGTSGCGATSSAMLVSSLKGNITPDQIGDLFIQYGYRSPNSGTYLSAFKWIADVFSLEYYHTTSIDTAVDLLRNNHYLIVSCGDGLFTYGGHIMFICGIDGDMLKIYDPYLYNGKFNTSTRNGKVEVDGTTVYCSIENFRNYANCTNYYAYSNDNTNNDNTSIPYVTPDNTSYTKYVKVSSYLNVRDNPNGSIVDKLYNGTQVIVYETSDNWSRIGDNKWISSDYLISTNSNSNYSSGYSLGLYKVTSSRLNVRSGPSTNYKAKKQYNYGTRFDTYEIKNNWAKTPSGWVCLDYCTLIKKY